MTAKEFKKLALSFEGTLEHPHFERTAFKVVKKKIFATLLEEKNAANIILPVKDQGVFCELDKAIYPVPNKWGTQGWTTFELKNLSAATVLDALDTAYKDVIAPKPRKK